MWQCVQYLYASAQARTGERTVITTTQPAVISTRELAATLGMTVDRLRLLARRHPDVGKLSVVVGGSRAWRTTDLPAIRERLKTAPRA